MVKIRLARVGAKKKPKYRIVVVDSREKRNSRFLEVVGYYDQTVDPAVVELKKDRVSYWLNLGARPSKTVSNLLRQYEKIG